MCAKESCICWKPIGRTSVLHFEQQVAMEQWWTKNTFIYVRSPCPLRSFSNSVRRSYTEKDRTRHEKQWRSEALCLHQVQRQTKRKYGNYQSKLSPEASSMRGSGKQRRKLGEQSARFFCRSFKTLSLDHYATVLARPPHMNGRCK